MNEKPNTEPFVGTNVLVVEDEGIVALWLTGMLEEFGCNVIGPAARLDEALNVATHDRIDAAVLDVNIAGESVYPVADRLAERGIPFIFATGYGSMGLIERHRDCPVVQKPYTKEAIRRALTYAVRGDD